MSDREEPELETLAEALADADSRVVESAVTRMRSRLGGLEGAEYRRAVDALCSLFYIDTADRPDLETALDRTADVLAEEGEKVVSLLIGHMKESDIKSHLYLARALGRIGPAALGSLRDVLATAEDPYARTFALYAIGKMRCREASEALPEVIGGLMHPDKEVRDTAARTVGRIVQILPPDTFSANRRREMYEALLRASTDHQAPVRAKALRSLGKLAAAGLLDSKQREGLATRARGALGRSDVEDWDHAFIVRREAREALENLGVEA